MLTSAVRKVHLSSIPSNRYQMADATKLGFVQLRVQIVVIEDEALPDQLEESADEKDCVRRVAGMDDVDAVGERNTYCENEFPEQGIAVLEGITQC